MRHISLCPSGIVVMAPVPAGPPLLAISFNWPIVLYQEVLVPSSPASPPSHEESSVHHPDPTPAELLRGVKRSMPEDFALEDINPAKRIKLDLGKFVLLSCAIYHHKS